jgi:hypothetical protein
VEGAVGSGIVDPVASNLNRIFLPGKNYKPYSLLWTSCSTGIPVV